MMSWTCLGVSIFCSARLQGFTRISKKLRFQTLHARAFETRCEGNDLGIVQRRWVSVLLEGEIWKRKEVGGWNKNLKNWWIHNMEQHGPMVQWSSFQVSGPSRSLAPCGVIGHCILTNLTVNHSDSENSPQAKPQLSCLRTIPVARMICWNTKLVAASLRSEEWDRRKVQQHHLYNI